MSNGGIGVLGYYLFWRFFNASTKGHVALFRLSGGADRWHRPRRTGPLAAPQGREKRQGATSPLQYMPDGDQFVIVASKGGHPKNPAWFHNLMANPDTEVELPKEGKVSVLARRATDEERETLWPRVVDLYSGYADY